MIRVCAKLFNSHVTPMRRQFQCLFYLPLGFAILWHDDGTCMVSGLKQSKN